MLKKEGDTDEEEWKARGWTIPDWLTEDHTEVDYLRRMNRLAMLPKETKWRERRELVQSLAALEWAEEVAEKQWELEKRYRDYVVMGRVVG